MVTTSRVRAVAALARLLARCQQDGEKAKEGYAIALQVIRTEAEATPPAGRVCPDTPCTASVVGAAAGGGGRRTELMQRVWCLSAAEACLGGEA